MTHCYNCGHTGTFVLLAQFALAVPGPDAGPERPRSDAGSDRSASDCSAQGDLALSVQCPTCDSTDVGVSAADLLARYGSRTTS